LQADDEATQQGGGAGGAGNGKGGKDKNKNKGNGNGNGNEGGATYVGGVNENEVNVVAEDREFESWASGYWFIPPSQEKPADTIEVGVNQPAEDREIDNGEEKPAGTIEVVDGEESEHIHGDVVEGNIQAEPKEQIGREKDIPPPPPPLDPKNKDPVDPKKKGTRALLSEKRNRRLNSIRGATNQ